MRLQQFAAAAVLAGASLFLISCGGTESTASDEAAIKAANQKWMELIASRDAKSIATEIYSENGMMLPPNAPKVAGREALEKGWGEMFNIPGMALTFETESLTFAKSGELAVEVGTYKFASGEGATQSTELGKAVVTWVKKDGKWQVLTDMFSSNAAPAAAAPAPAAADPAAVVDPAAAPVDGAAAAPATPAAAPATPPAH